MNLLFNHRINTFVKYELCINWEYVVYLGNLLVENEDF